jgi:cytochrome b561
MAAIWIFSWCAGMIAVHLREELNPHHAITAVHKASAATILFLVVVRIAWRLAHPAPPLPTSMSPLIQRVAHAGHLALYAVALVALPVSGWMWSSVADKPIFVLGLFFLPPLVAPHPEFYDLAKWVHTLTAWTTGALVGGHIIVALKHHFIDRDGVMQTMLPTTPRQSRRRQG